LTGTLLMANCKWSIFRRSSTQFLQKLRYRMWRNSWRSKYQV